MTTKQILKPADLKNAVGLKKDHLSALIRYLACLENLDDALADHAVRYVVEGTDEDVLLRLGGQKEAADILRLDGTGMHTPWQQFQAGTKERARIWRPGHPVPPGVFIRLAQVFDAARRAAGQVLPAPASWPSWLATLFYDIISVWQNDDRSEEHRPAWTLAELEAILQSAELPSDLLASTFLNQKLLLTLSLGYYTKGVFTEWAEYLGRHAGTVREVLAQSDAENRLHALRMLSHVKFNFRPVVDLLVQLGTGSAKTVREASLPLLDGCRDAARPLVQQTLAEGDAGQRHEAALLLWRLDGHDALESLRQHLARESSERVRQTIEKLLAAPDEQATQVAEELRASLPPVRVEVGEVPLPEATKEALRQLAEKGHQQALNDYERALEQWKAPDRPTWMSKPSKPASPMGSEFEKLLHFAEAGANWPKNVNHTLPVYFYRSGGQLGEAIADPGVKLVHLVRLAYALNFLNLHEQGNRTSMWWHNTADLEAYRGRSPEKFGLRELDAAVASLPGARPGLVAEAYLANNNRWRSFCDWEPEAVWPVFAEQPDVLRGLLGPAQDRAARYATGDYWWADKRRAAFRVLAMFPQLPPGFIPLLWDLALGDSKVDRPLAQAALASVPDKAPRIRVALSDGKQVVRAAAAEWLGKLGEPSAVEPLREAFRKEKQEVVKGALMTALEALGADVNEFLDRGALLKEAEEGLAKKRPKSMDWVPLASLPALHWADTGKPVEPRIVQWWVVQSVQQKSPVCGPLLRRYLGMCRPHEAAALARFLLTSWIGHDTRTPSHEEAAERARKKADQQWAMYGKHQYWIDLYKGDKENLYRQLYTQYSNQFVGSAIAGKGVLALVAPAADAECVKLCEQYIRKWFGNRLAQCKVLTEVLAWIRHPLAIQALLGFATRFRTKAVRQAAEQYVQALAEREGWTLDELADRTVPDAGFARPVDESGAPVGSEATLALGYGPRQFTVRLNDGLEPVITTAEGKTVKGLPAPGKQDDAEKAKAARKAFSDARKTVKEVVKRQTERLYEALCTQRAWRCDDWRRYLADHPIVGKLCVRLAWAAFAPEGDGGAERFLGCFRPLEDGSLTNEQDEEVTFPEDAVVRLAHTCNTAPEVGESWLRHFEDYDVTPPFQQFGRATYALPEEKKKETDVTDFRGHLLTTFQLRGKATKLGYLRGDAEDGGCFYTYRKPFPSLGVQAVLSFTGSMLPEQDVQAALGELYFTNLKGDREVSYSWQPSKLPLGKVPPVLLSECYNDIRQIAAEGSGYDPEWQKKTYF
jgi:HEAT repeat protein